MSFTVCRRSDQKFEASRVGIGDIWDSADPKRVLAVSEGLRLASSIKKCALVLGGKSERWRRRGHKISGIISAEFG